MVTAPVWGHSYRTVRSSKVVAQGFDELTSGGTMSSLGGRTALIVSEE